MTLKLSELGFFQVKKFGCNVARAFSRACNFDLIIVHIWAQNWRPKISSFVSRERVASYTLLIIKKTGTRFAVRPQVDKEPT